jgi:cell fate regulator YaaT (PSP1 superfamily)
MEYRRLYPVFGDKSEDYGGIWVETTERWDDGNSSWKAVGACPRRRYQDLRLGEFISYFDKKKEIEQILESRKTHYRVLFSSGEECIGMFKRDLHSGDYVIIEADRGEDCAVILEEIEYQGRDNEIRIIVRKATDEDLNVLENKRREEIIALGKCTDLVKERGHPMEITRCEYQWDMKKITFYFRSMKRIDFRDLVKELFRHFKVRIWMSMENRR